MQASLALLRRQQRIVGSFLSPFGCFESLKSCFEKHFKPYYLRTNPAGTAIRYFQIQEYKNPDHLALFRHPAERSSRVPEPIDHRPPDNPTR